MATKPAVPNYSVPIAGPDGRINTDWLKRFAEQGHSGTPATTATGGAATLPANPVGFITIYVNGTERKVPYYAV